MVDFSGLLPADVIRPTGLLHTLLTMSPMAIAVLRPLYAEDGETIRDFTWVSLNPAGQRMLALPACPAESLLTLFPHAQAADGDFSLYQRVFASGELGENRTNYQADGVDGYFRTVAQRYENVLVVNFTDTNDQPRSAVEQALRESQAAEQAARAEAEVQRQRFYDLLMQLPAQVAVHEGPDQVFTLVNPGYQRLAPGRELQGQPIREAWPELVSQGILDVLDHVYQTGEPFIGKELPFQVDFTRTGTFEQVYFNAFFLPLRDVQGQLRGVLDFSYDVTEQVLARQHLQQFNAELEARVQERTQLAEQALATAERERTLLQIILAQSPVAIGVFQGEELRITAANAQMAALWGRTPEQVLNLPFMDAVPELRGQGFDDLLRQVLHTRVPFIGTETPADVLRGEHVQTHYYNFVYQPLYAADGQVLGAIDVAVEVTEQVLARRQVQALNEALTTTNGELGASNRQLTRTNIDLDNFIYTASHDLKAPITNIEGLLLALEHELPEAARTGDVSLMLTMMQDAVVRFQHTISHLTDLSRLQKEHNPASDAVALAPVVEAVRLDLTPLLVQTQGQLMVTIPEGLTVQFAEKNLRSVVYNLLSNAFKYRHPDRVPEVQLRSWLADDYVLLEVQDNGLGLDLAQGQEKLFAMFQRLHTHVEGTGVGLYMVKRILENAGGRIEVESQLGQGSTFRVYFPR